MKTPKIWLIAWKAWNYLCVFVYLFNHLTVNCRDAILSWTKGDAECSVHLNFSTFFLFHFGFGFVLSSCHFGVCAFFLSSLSTYFNLGFFSSISSETLKFCFFSLQKWIWCDALTNQPAWVDEYRMWGIEIVCECCGYAARRRQTTNWTTISVWTV